MSFDERAAPGYDAWSRRGDEDATVRFLEQAARGGPALELAIGTGRIALPLAARGVRVDGIDLSPAMVEQLRAKPGGRDIDVTIGDFADVPVEGTYRLIFVVFNTLFNLLSQEEQVRCFENVAAHLTDDGVFVVEGLVPAYLYRLRDDQHVDAEAVGVDWVRLDVARHDAAAQRLDVARHDAAAQRLDECHVTLGRDGIRVDPVVQRYSWPSELDLMARIAGLRLVERWGAWDRAQFDGASRNCISVYGR